MTNKIIKKLREMIYSELFDVLTENPLANPDGTLPSPKKKRELHKKGHKDPKGRGILKDKKKEVEEAINKSDAKYTMKMVFDNNGFGKALKHMKILRNGITLNMSSYMGPSKTLDKIVKDFNDIMGTKYKADKDSFQKGHVTSIELKEGVNESDENYRKALEKIARDRQLHMLSKKDKETLLKIAKLMKKEKEKK